MIILLDIDGVLVTTPPWRKVEILQDGFMQFNETASKLIASLIADTQASVVLTTSHNHLFSIAAWTNMLTARGIVCQHISRIADSVDLPTTTERCQLIQAWFETIQPNEPFLIIDDDPSLHNLPMQLKQRWIQPKFLIGFDAHCLMQAEKILGEIQGNTSPN